MLGLKQVVPSKCYFKVACWLSVVVLGCGQKAMVFLSNLSVVYASKTHKWIFFP